MQLLPQRSKPIRMKVLSGNLHEFAAAFPIFTLVQTKVIYPAKQKNTKKPQTFTDSYSMYDTTSRQCKEWKDKCWKRKKKFGIEEHKWKKFMQ